MFGFLKSLIFFAWCCLFFVQFIGLAQAKDIIQIELDQIIVTGGINENKIEPIVKFAGVNSPIDGSKVGSKIKYFYGLKNRTLSQDIDVKYKIGSESNNILDLFVLDIPLSYHKNINFRLGALPIEFRNLNVVFSNDEVDKIVEDRSKNSSKAALPDYYRKIRIHWNARHKLQNKVGHTYLYKDVAIGYAYLKTMIRLIKDFHVQENGDFEQVIAFLNLMLSRSDERKKLIKMGYFQRTTDILDEAKSLYGEKMNVIWDDAVSKNKRCSIKLPYMREYKYRIEEFSLEKQEQISSQIHIGAGTVETSIAYCFSVVLNGPMKRLERKELDTEEIIELAKKVTQQIENLLLANTAKYSDSDMRDEIKMHFDAYMNKLKKINKQLPEEIRIDASVYSLL